MKNNFIMDIVSLTLLVGMLSTKSFGQIALTKTNIIRLKQSTDNEMTVGEYATNTDDVQPEDEEECICTPYYLCRTANESSQVGDGIIDVRINLAPRCSSYMDVCCKNGMITQPIKNNPNQNNNYNNNENNNHNNNDNNNNNKHHNNDNDNNNNNGDNNNNNNGNNNNNNNNGNNNNNNDNDNTGNNNNNNNNNNDNDNSGNNNNNNNNNNDNDNTGNNNNNNGNNNNNNNNGNNNDNNHNDNNNNNHNNNNVKECVCNDKGQGTLSTIIKNESGGSSNYNKPESNGHETENNIICSPDKEHCYPDSTYPGELKCGIWNKVGVGFRVINTIGGESQYGEFPSMVAIFKVEESANGEKKLLYHCGGSLIETNVVLTAAHCVIRKDISTFIVRAGEWDLKTEKEIYTHQDREVSKIVTHKEYYSGGLHNDVALIFTEKPFSLQKHIQLVCLPEENDVYDETLCYSSGWGMDVSHNNYTIVKKTKHGISKEIGQYEYNILKNVDLPIVPREECTKALKSTRLGAKFILHESFICAGGVQGKDTCKGDGGSPLVCPSKNDPNSLVQVGIVSWGVDCGLEKIPGLYVNVAKFRKWIDNEIAHYQTGTNNER